MRLDENKSKIIMKNSIYILLGFIILVLLPVQSCKKDSSGDGTKPVIVVLGQSTMYWALDIPYVDQGATAYDVIASGDTVDITNYIVTENNVDVTIIGDYMVKYNVKDESGESAEEKVRSVKVVVGK